MDIILKRNHHLSAHVKQNFPVNPYSTESNKTAIPVVRVNYCFVQVVTLATVEPSGRVTSPPLIRAASTASQVVVAVDNCLIIFSSDCSEATPLVFQHNINTTAISECGRFLSAGLQNGSLQFVHLPLARVLSGQQVCAGLEEEQGLTFTASLYAREESGDTSKLVLCRQGGQLFTFSHIELERLHTAIMAGDLETIRASQARVVVGVEEVGEVVTDCAVLPTDLQILSATRTGLVRDRQAGDSLELAGCVKILTSRSDPSILLCLDQEGNIHTVCPLTLVILSSWRPSSRASSAEILQDVILLEDNQLLALSEDQLRGEHFLSILDFPTYRTLYKLAVSSSTHLVSSHPSQDSPLVLEGGQEDVLQPELVTRLRLRAITEGVPEARLARLLKRGKFDEAEKFAARFNLEAEQIHRARSSFLLHYLSPWAAEDPAWPHSSVLEQVKTCLAKMTDTNYVVEFCVTAAVPSLVMTRDLITFARRKIGSTQEEVGEALLLRVGNTLHRLETFSCLTAGEADTDIDQWLDFMRASMLETVRTFLARGDLTRARLVWVRHQAEFRESLQVETVRELLDILGDGLRYEDLLPWLNQFIPDALQLVPACLPALASWAVEAVTRLELTHRATWPLCGLSLARDVLATMTFSRNSTSDFSQFMSLLTLNQQRTEPGSPLSQLVNLIKALEDLLVLHKKFRIKLKLSEFTDPVKFNVVSLILDWVNSTKEISALMDGFLRELLRRWELDVNKTLSEYIVSVLDNTSFTWHWHIGAAPWEEKVASLVQYITNVEDKTKVILEAVKNAPVPWSSDILELSEEGGKLQHELSALIKEQTRLVGVKAILRKYDCKSYATTGRQAERLLMLLMKKGGEEGYRDALEISKVIGGKTELEMEKMYLEHLLRQELNSQSAVQRIRANLEEKFERGLDLACHVVDTAKMILKLEVGAEIEKCYMDVVKFISASLSGSRRDHCVLVEDVRGKAEAILRAAALKTEFGLKTEESSLAEGVFSISSGVHCRQLLQQFIDQQIEQFSPETEEVGDRVRDVYNKLKRLTDLLCLQQEEAVAGLVLRLEKLGQRSEALRVADMIRQERVSSELADSLYNILHKMRGGGLVSVADTMMNQTLTFCSDSSLADCLELRSWQRLEVCLQKEKAGLESRESGVYSAWRFSHLYTDQGLPLHTDDLLPLTAACLTSVLPLVEETPLPFLPRSRPANVEIQDMDVTAPDLESLGNGVDAAESCNLLASAGNSLVSSLQASGHVLLGLRALQATSSPMSVLLLGTEPELQAQANMAVNQAR